MKNYFIGAGLVLVMLVTWLFGLDTNTLIEQKKKLDACAEDMANAAALYYDLENYTAGYFVFNADEGVKAAINILKDRFKLSENDYSKSSYYNDAFDYKIRFYDDSGTYFLMRSHDESGSPYGLFDHIPQSFTYHNTMYKTIKNQNITINYPSIIVEINAGRPSFFARIFGSLGIELKGVGIYEYQD